MVGHMIHGMPSDAGSCAARALRSGATGAAGGGEIWGRLSLVVAAKKEAIVNVENIPLTLLE